MKYPGMMKKETETITALMDTLSFEDISRRTVTGVEKSNKLSEILRKKANLIFNNELHNSSSHELIWKLYSRCVALAERGTQELAFAYANRSAILLHMSKYQASLMDIDRALSLSLNECLQMKLLIRKAKCLHALGSDESKDALDKANDLLQNIKVQDLKKMFVKDITRTKSMLKKAFEPLESSYDKKASMLKNLNKWYRNNDFSSVEMKSDEKNDRHLVANANIYPGQILYIERPFVHSVNRENTHSYCYHCLTTTWASVPCENCSWAMFCSEECREQAFNEYHDIECAINFCMTQDLDNNCTQLAVKAVCIAMKKNGDFKSLKDELAEFDKSKDVNKKLEKNDGISSNGFQSMYILPNNVTKSKMQRHKESVSRFLYTLRILSTPPEDLYNKDNDSFIKNENTIFLGALFLRLSTVCEMNKLDMWNGYYKCPNGSMLKVNCSRPDCCSKGTYIAPVTSLIKHSCNPNVNVCYSNDHKTIVYALQPIKKGEQIFRCYQEEYFLMEKSARKQLLSTVYNFQCNCKACASNWENLLFNENCLIPDALNSKTERMIDLSLGGSANFNERLIVNLSFQLTKALKMSPKPTLESVNLIRTLIIIFNQLYGITLSVPSKCNSEIRII